MKRTTILVLAFMLCVAGCTLAQNVLGIGGQPATAFATSLSQCPTVTQGYFLCVVAPGGTTQPFLALSVAGWNSGTPFQVVGLSAIGTLTAGNLVVSAGGNQVKDGGAVPVVPSNIVTAPASIATGHLMVAGTNPLNAVDGGTVPTVPSNLLTYTGTLTLGNALKINSATGQVVDAGFAAPNFLNLTAINCKTAALSNGTITCGSGSTIQ